MKLEEVGVTQPARHGPYQLRLKFGKQDLAGRQRALHQRVYRGNSTFAADARQPTGSPAMIRLTVLVATAALALASSAALAQGVGKSGDAPKATPATPATPAPGTGTSAQPATPATPGQPPKAQAPQDGKSSAMKSSKGDPTKTQKRAGDPKGTAKGQTK